MKKLTIILVLGTIVLGALWYASTFPSGQQTSSTASSTTALPMSGNVTQTTTTGQTSARPYMSVMTQNGPIPTNDFIHNGVTIPDPSNADNYYLTGTTTSSGYTIKYDAASGFFTIALEQEPLAQTRAAAEVSLLSALGVTQAQLCSLNYYVGTDVHTNSFYAGKNLSFSFCPGAVVLPQ